MQRIGQTGFTLHKNINLHRSAIKNYNSYQTPHKCNIEYNHFKLHEFNNITIPILNAKTKNKI